ncbi:MAG: T9SS type A sorting domain-containing protein [Bacteroidetes bacterium]|nr:T9SS type A sorting domain-containing protein [Bacteroidota bacterium]
MILNKHISSNLFLIILFCLGGLNVSAQNQTILIFDPNQVSTNFQNSFHQLSSDSIYIVDSLDENINNFDVLFLFIGYPYVLSEEEGNRLIEYLNQNKPIYFYTNLYWQGIDSVAFWNHIGITWYAETLAEVQVDSVVGVDTAFTKGIVIDTSFTSSGAPHIGDNVKPILDGIEYGNTGLRSTFVPENDSLKVIIDLYNLIHRSEFLERVLIHFGLEDPTNIIDDNADQPNTFYLHQNYPNPFNPSTKIKFTIPTSPLNPSPYQGEGNRGRLITLKVYDVLGNEIATLVNEVKPAGIYEVDWDASRFSSGVYFYQLNAGSFVETKKMILLR